MRAGWHARSGSCGTSAPLSEQSHGRLTRRVRAIRHEPFYADPQVSFPAPRPSVVLRWVAVSVGLALAAMLLPGAVRAAPARRRPDLKVVVVTRSGDTVAAGAT